MASQIDVEGAHLAAFRRLADFRGRRVLEIGCGDGRLTAGIAAEASSVFAFDTKAAEVEKARTALAAEVGAGAVELAVASAVDVALPRAAFDIAVWSWSF
jgi:predicted RNA methylase